MLDSSYLGLGQIVLRLLSALIAGGAIGLDREWLRKTAGIKTHMVFALACASMSIMAFDIYSRKSIWAPATITMPRASCKGSLPECLFLGPGRSCMDSIAFMVSPPVLAYGWPVFGLVFGTGLFKLGVVTLIMGLTILIFIRLVEPRDIKRRRLAAERNGEAEPSD